MNGKYSFQIPCGVQYGFIAGEVCFEAGTHEEEKAKKHIEDSVFFFHNIMKSQPPESKEIECGGSKFVKDDNGKWSRVTV